MSHSRRPRKYRDLTPEEFSKTYRLNYGFDELFEPRGKFHTDKEKQAAFELQLTNLIRTARMSIIGVFKETREPYRKATRRTDNYVSVREDFEALLMFLQSTIRNPIIRCRDLSARFDRVWPEDREAIRKVAVEQLIVAALLQLCDPANHDLWYDERRSIWQMSQSCIDEPRLLRQQTRDTANAVKGFYDSRTYHGRNGRQARPRDRGNGNAYRSTGFASQVH